MIAIINYEAGNLASVSNALTRLGAEHRIAGRPDELETARAVIFPGVGHANPAMQSLRKNGVDRWLQQTNKPVLGICLGMQLMFESSEEGNSTGLGLIPGRLRKFRPGTEKIPHMGWNTFSKVRPHPLMEGLQSEDYFYYVHSYYAPEGNYTLASCQYIHGFSAVVAKDNVLGVQFHPEKSGKAGAHLLENFLRIAGG